MIDSFRGKHRFLSNFYNCNVEYEGLVYPSAESAFQAAKTTNESERHQFTEMTSVSAKKAGRRVSLRPDWDHIKLGVMHDVVYAKFWQNPDLRRKLINTTHEELIEGNTWNDKYWGICEGKGENHLGKILMKVRDELTPERPIYFLDDLENYQ